MAEQWDHFMGDSDAVMWTIERDPMLRSTIVAISLLDRRPDWARVVQRVDRATRFLPRLRQRVMTTPLRLAPPRWVVDPDFDLANHLDVVTAPSPGDFGSVLELARESAQAGFDRKRPLWAFTLVEGLPDGRAALIQKLHHSLTDGIGAMRLALELYDTVREPSPQAGPPEPPEPEQVAWPARVGEGMTFVGGQLRRTAGDALRRSVELVRRGVRHPVDVVADGVRLARSVGHVLKPITHTASDVMEQRTTSWHYRVLDRPIETFEAAARAVDATINDVFVAGISGGMRRYHDDHGSTVGELWMTMPISYRSESDPIGGNRFVPARFPIPIDVQDPVERVRLLSERCRAWKDEPALPLTNALATVFDHLPAAFTTSIFGGMLKHVDLVSTNVPGFRQPVYLAGARVDRLYALAPLMGAAVNIALVSHGDRCCIGITSDAAAVSDPDHLAECLANGIDEIVDLGSSANEVGAVPAQRASTRQ
jgi:diacylglycerol O-acyltransferase / wax synthase